MYGMLEHRFMAIVNYSIMVLEAVGVVILLVYFVKALIAVFKSTSKCKQLLAEGITTALSFLLGGEVLKTIVAPDWKDIGMTCAGLLMRAAMSLLIHWETHSLRAEEKEHSTGGAEIGE